LKTDTELFEDEKMKILLAVDGSSFSDAAVAEVASRPWPANSEVKILSVAEPPILPMVESWAPSGNYFEEIVKIAETQAQNIVRKAASELRDRQGDKLRITTEVIEGQPRFVITGEAERWGADLILVGSHGYRGLTRLWLGSVSQTVATHAPCSVEIVHSRRQQSQLPQ
jgi:nucleotide-binding universal stress UspA family protein